MYARVCISLSLYLCVCAACISVNTLARVCVLVCVVCMCALVWGGALHKFWLILSHNTLKDGKVFSLFNFWQTKPKTKSLFWHNSLNKQNRHTEQPVTGSITKQVVDHLLTKIVNYFTLQKLTHSTDFSAICISNNFWPRMDAADANLKSSYSPPITDWETLLSSE